jgi:hypothetical protein
MNRSLAVARCPKASKSLRYSNRRGKTAVDLSKCVQENPGADFSPMYYPEGWMMFTAEGIKKEVNIPDHRQ